MNELLTESQQIIELEFPQLPRKFILQYLLNKVGRITRGQVEQLATEFYADALLERHRTLVEVIKDSAIFDKNIAKKLEKDHVLNHVSLVYKKQEMEEFETMDFFVSLIDRLNRGPIRPVIKGFYALSDTLGYAYILGGFGNEVFRPTDVSYALTDSIRFNFEDLRDKDDLVLLVGGFDQKFVPRAQLNSILLAA